MNAPVSAHRKARPESVDALNRAHADRHNLRGQASLLDTQSFLDCNLAKGVHRHFDVLGLNPRLIL